MESILSTALSGATVGIPIRRGGNISEGTGIGLFKYSFPFDSMSLAVVCHAVLSLAYVSKYVHSLTFVFF